MKRSYRELFGDAGPASDVWLGSGFEDVSSHDMKPNPDKMVSHLVSTSKHPVFW